MTDPTAPETPTVDDDATVDTLPAAITLNRQFIRDERYWSRKHRGSISARKVAGVSAVAEPQMRRLGGSARRSIAERLLASCSQALTRTAARRHGRQSGRSCSSRRD